MATTFKTFLNNDIAATRTMLHEAIPITGSLVSGTYGGNTIALGSEPHIKSYSHGMFQSVYDYPYLSSSANHIFDIAIGVSTKGALYSQTTSQQSKKANIYNQMAQVLMGHDVTGSIQEFDEDGNILAGGTKLQEVFFLNFARLLAKDEVKKGSFELELGVTSDYSEAVNGHFARRIKLTDASGSNGFFVNSPAGEYGVLYAQTTADGDGDATDALASFCIADETAASSTHPPCGLIFYQAGIAVISGSVFNDAAIGGILDNSTTDAMEMIDTFGYNGFNFVSASTIDTSANKIRTRIYNMQFNNTTELNSSIYFCRINHNDFNYSSNPTYLSGSKIRVKDSTVDNPVTYLTTVGLYSADNELLAVAKLSEPLKKDPSTEMTLRVRLDY
jgi:hypothetical protein